MNINQSFKYVNKEYETIVNANLKSNLLSVKDGQFKTVGFFGRIWRVITGQSFDDCKAVTVAKAIVDLACHKKITNTQREFLKLKLEQLKSKVTAGENQAAIDKELERIENQIQKGEDRILLRLEKNQKYAADQQGKEKAQGFIVEQGKVPQSVSIGKQIGNFSIGNQEKMPIDGENRNVNGKQVGMACCQGRRKEMEDAEIAEHDMFKTPDNQEHSFEVFGVFDGHGGAEASAYVKENLMDYLKKALKNNNLKSLTDEGIFQALKECFQKLGHDYKGEDGTTATVAVTLNGKVWVANVGDSRTILVNKDGATIQASEDAKPDMDRYQKKIDKLGGWVEKSGRTARIGGMLAVGRAIGDKGVLGVSSSPKITAFPIEQFKGGHLVLACDGLYEKATSNEVGASVAKMVEDGESVENMGKRLVYQAIKNGSRDNVSVMVIKL